MSDTTTPEETPVVETTPATEPTTAPETPVVETTPATEPTTAPETPENVVPFTPATEESSAAVPAPQVAFTDASSTPVAEQPEEARPLLVSRLIHVIGQFLSEHVEKPTNEMSEEMKHLFALFSQHLMLVNSINADEALAHKVIEAVDKEIAKVTEEFGGERKSSPVASEPNNIIVPNIH